MICLSEKYIYIYIFVLFVCHIAKLTSVIVYNFNYFNK